MICPGCKQPCRVLKSGKLSEHKTANYVAGQRPGGRIRERCVYSGGTPRDAAARISPLRRAILDRTREESPLRRALLDRIARGDWS